MLLEVGSDACTSSGTKTSGSEISGVAGLARQENQSRQQ